LDKNIKEYGHIGLLVHFAFSITSGFQTVISRYKITFRAQEFSVSSGPFDVECFDKKN